MADPTPNEEWTREKISEAMHAAAKAGNAAIRAEANKLPAKYQWLVYSRALNAIFNGHYNPLFREVEKLVDDEALKIKNHESDPKETV